MRQNNSLSGRVKHILFSLPEDVVGDVNKLNISQAVYLQKQIHKPNSVDVKLLCFPKEGCTLAVKIKSAESENYDNLERFAVENNLSWVFEQGYWILFG